jgi:hypothetical protein
MENRCLGTHGRSSAVGLPDRAEVAKHLDWARQIPILSPQHSKRQLAIGSTVTGDLLLQSYHLESFATSAGIPRPTSDGSMQSGLVDLQ